MYIRYQVASKWTVLFAAAALGLLLMISGCAEDDDQSGTPPPQSPGADTYGPETIRQWSDFCYRMVKADTVGPAPASRIYGYMGVAYYEAVVQGDSSRMSLANQLTDLTSLPQPDANAEYHWPTVLNATSAAMMQALFTGGPHQSTRDSIIAYEAYWNNILQGTVEQSVFTRSQSYGQALGAALVDWANADGYSQNHNCSWTPPVGDQYWVPTPPAFKPAHEPCWGSMRTFTLERSGSDFECEPPLPYEFSTNPSSQFYQEALEVVTVQENETPEDSVIAAFWADVPGSTGAPAGHWWSISGLLSDQYDMNLAEAAECYARSSIAMHDAFIECWKVKYQFAVIRPVTYINRYIDSTWVPSWPTPNFPEYTSGHSSCSGACQIALEGLMGLSCAFVDHTHDYRGFAPRSYSTLSQAAEEAALSRLLGGIHYRNGNNQGLVAGRCVGEQVNQLGFYRVDHM